VMSIFCEARQVIKFDLFVLLGDELVPRALRAVARIRLCRWNRQDLGGIFYAELASESPINPLG
jgi:hypothetical protein